MGMRGGYEKLRSDLMNSSLLSNLLCGSLCVGMRLLINPR